MGNLSRVSFILLSFGGLLRVFFSASCWQLLLYTIMESSFSAATPPVFLSTIVGVIFFSPVSHYWSCDSLITLQSSHTLIISCFPLTNRTRRLIRETYLWNMLIKKKKGRDKKSRMISMRTCGEAKNDKLSFEDHISLPSSFLFCRKH